MCGSMVDIQSATAEIRRGIKKEDRRKKLQGQKMSASATQGGHNNWHSYGSLAQWQCVILDQQSYSTPGPRSSDKMLLSHPYMSLVMADKALSVSAPKVWNDSSF